MICLVVFLSIYSDSSMVLCDTLCPSKTRISDVTVLMQSISHLLSMEDSSGLQQIDNTELLQPIREISSGMARFCSQHAI